MPKHTHYTLTKIQKVKKHNSTFKHQINILQLFLMDTVSLKTRVMASENSALHNRNYIVRYIKIEKY